MKRKLSLNGVKYIENDGTINIAKSIESIDDLIHLGRMYRPYKKYNIDLKRINNIIQPLNLLKNMIGLDDIKHTLINQIVYFLQDFHKDEMLHTVIQGPPGVGKTMLARIIGDIYHKLNVFSQEDTDECKFVIARRSDLIGEYLGTTAKKTQNVINSCRGGVLLIDEAYSLGNSEGRDSYSKECIDTLNQNLSENKNNFMCIIAGYKEALEKNFFNYNQGLTRRFPFVYTLSDYTSKELTSILCHIFERENWYCYDKNGKIHSLIEKNFKEFNNMAGDMETLALITKLEHSKRVLFLHKSLKKYITYEDIEKGIDKFLLQKKSKHSEQNESMVMSHMYL